MDFDFLKDFLDQKVSQYNSPDFISTDPIQVPHRFSKKEDIEIAGFLTATIAWGNRTTIINNANRMMDLMENQPHNFIVSLPDYPVEKLAEKFPELLKFVHRTFNGYDFLYFLKSLQNIYSKHGGMESLFLKHAENNSLQKSIHHFRKIFFELPHLKRTEKHLGDPLKNSAAKRTNMFLRWMIRKDKSGVDFGLWKSLSPAQLSCPLDVHSGNVARKLKLLTRKQNDARALAELDASLRRLDPEDPVQYDFALFGLGVFEGF